MLVKTVEAILTTNTAGQVVESLPVLPTDEVYQNTAGNWMSPIEMVEDEAGVPIRIVDEAVVLNSIGQPVTAIRGTGDGTWGGGSANDEDEEMAAFIERLVREGDFRSIFGSAKITPAAGGINTQVAALAAPPTVGKVLWAQQLSASFDKPALGQLLITADASGRFPSNGWQFLTRLEPTLLNFPIRGFTVTNGIVALNVREMLSTTPGTDTLSGGISLSGFEITDDLDWGAPKVIMIAGDSTICGTGPTRSATHWPFMFKKYLRDTYGIRARLVAKSRSGSTTADHELWRAAGWHDIEQCNLGIYNVSINDVINATANNVTVANMMAYWDWFKLRYPTAPLILCGTTPLENNTPEALAATLRTAIPAAIALRPAEEQARLKFINLGSAFDRTVAANYASSDPGGSRIHPDDDGNALIAPVFNAAFTALYDAGFRF